MSLLRGGKRRGIPGRRARIRQVYLVVTSRLPLARCSTLPPASDPYFAPFFSRALPSERASHFLEILSISYIIMVIDVNSELSIHGYVILRDAIIGILANSNVQRKQKGEEGIKRWKKQRTFLRYYLMLSFYVMYMCFH